MSTNIGEMDSEFGNFMILMMIFTFTLFFMRTCTHAGRLSRLRQAKRLHHCFPVPVHVAQQVPPEILQSLTYTHLHQLYRSRPHTEPVELNSVQLTSDIVNDSVKVTRTRSSRSSRCTKETEKHHPKTGPPTKKTIQLEIRSVCQFKQVQVQFFWGVSPNTIKEVVYSNSSTVPKRKTSTSSITFEPAPAPAPNESTKDQDIVDITIDAQLDETNINDPRKAVGTDDVPTTATTTTTTTTATTTTTTTTTTKATHTNSGSKQKNNSDQLDSIQRWQEKLTATSLVSTDAMLQSCTATGTTTNSFCSNVFSTPLPSTGRIFPMIVLVCPNDSVPNNVSTTSQPNRKVDDDEDNANGSGTSDSASLPSLPSSSPRILVETTDKAMAMLCIIEDTQTRPSSYNTFNHKQGELKEDTAMTDNTYPLTVTAKITVAHDGSKYLLQSMYGLTDMDAFQDPNGVPICITCMEAPREVLILPCRHIVLCSNCESRVQTCPLCKSPKDSIVRFVS